MEIWKDVKGYEGLYKVSNKCNVVSLPRLGTKGKLMKPLDNGKGYLRIKLSKNDISKRVMLHRIISEAFIENKENKPYVNHINGNKKDNSISNLEWCTQSENCIHALKTGLRDMKNKKGYKVINVVTNEIFNSIREASNYYNIDRSYLAEKLNGKIKNNTNLMFLKQIHT